MDQYLKIWEEEKSNLQVLQKEDIALVKGAPYTNTEDIKKRIGNLYIRYTRVSNDLSEMADTVTDPELSRFFLKMFELTTARVLHLNEDLNRLHFRELIPLDDLLVQNDATPYDIQLKIPRSYFLEKKQEIINRNEMFMKARKEIRNELSDSVAVDHLEDVNNHPDPEYVSSRMEEASFQKRSEKKLGYKELREAFEVTTRKKHKRRIKEDLKDEVFQWLTESYKKFGEFPPFPTNAPVFLTGEIQGLPKLSPEFREKMSLPARHLPADDFSRNFVGLTQLCGTALVAVNAWVTTAECKEIQAQLKAAKESEKRNVTKKLTKVRDEEETEGFFLSGGSELVKMMKILQEQNVNGVSNKVDCLEEDVLMELGHEFRQDVDKSMEVTHKALTAALNKDLFPRKRNKKKTKTGTKKKKANKKDLIAELSTEECIEELINNGVLKITPCSRVEDFIADRSWTNSPETANGSIIDFLLQRCILPLISPAIHYLSPLTRSVCLIGPRGCGKHYLTNLVATTTGATVFDLSPARTTGIFPGKTGVKRLMDLVDRLTRELQPSIVLLEEVEKMFYSKVPKNEMKLNPKRLQAELIKFAKKIGPSDRVLLIGTSTAPWLAKKAKLFKTVGRYVNVPVNHYGTHKFIWDHLLPMKAVENSVAANLSSKLGLVFSELSALKHSLADDNAPSVLEELSKVPGKEDTEKKIRDFLMNTPIAASKESRKKRTMKKKK